MIASTTQVWEHTAPSRGPSMNSTAFASRCAAAPAELAYLREIGCPYVLIDANSGEILEVSEFFASLGRDPAFVAELQRVIRQQEQAELRSYVSRESAKQECISVVVGDWEDDALDLLFVVEGDLYDGESAVLPIMRGLRNAFPSIAFDVMILPQRIYTPQFPWGDAPEVLYRRQQAMI